MALGVRLLGLRVRGQSFRVWGLGCGSLRASVLRPTVLGSRVWDLWGSGFKA